MSSAKREVVYAGFDEALWKAGVAGGAFSGTKDSDAVWYLLDVGDVKVAIASATPGPGELTNIAYYVDPEHREKGYGTKIASQVADRHEKASFLMMKSNGGSVKVALAALKNKFSMTLGHNTVRLTKEAGKKDDVEKKEIKALKASMTGIAASELVNRGMLHASLRNPKRLTFSERRELRSVAGKHPINFNWFVSPGEEMTFHVPGAAKAIVDVSTHSPKDIVLHEIGHAKTMTLPVIGRMLHVARNLSGMISGAPISARAAGAAGAAAVIASDPDSVVAKAAPYALAASMPHVGALPSEIAASGYAIGHLAKKLEFANAAKGVGRLGLALGTYALPAVSVGLSAELLRRYLSRREKRASVEKDAIRDDLRIPHPLQATEDPEKKKPFKAPKIATDTGKSHQDTVGTALESKIHESFTVAADRIFRAGMVSVNERKALSGAIGDMLNRFRSKVDADVYGRKMTENAHEHLKAAATERGLHLLIRARQLAAKEHKMPWPRHLDEAAKAIKKSPLTAPDQVRAMDFRGTLKDMGPRQDPDLERKIRKALRGRIGAQENLL